MRSQLTGIARTARTTGTQLSSSGRETIKAMGDGRYANVFMEVFERNLLRDGERERERSRARERYIERERGEMGRERESEVDNQEV